jgi:hypothetical protein
MEKFTPTGREITDWIGNKRITWCGPYSVATVCGKSYEEAYQLLRKIRGKRHAKGVSNGNIKDACNKLGVKGEWKHLEKRTQMRKFLPTLEAGKVYIVQITRHVLVVDTRDMTTIDNQHQDWIAAESSKHIRKLVHAVFEVENPKFDPKSQDDWLILPLAAGAK